MQRSVDTYNFYEVTNFHTAQVRAAFLFELRNSLLTGDITGNGIML